MTAPVAPSNIPTMPDPDQIVLCDHDRKPRECPICGGERPEHPVFDPNVWVERYRAASRETANFPDELAGLPLH